MDRNTIIGLSLIGVTLVLFTVLNKPSDAEVKKEKQQQAQVDKKEREEERKADEVAEKSGKKAQRLVVKKDANGQAVKDSLGNAVYTNPETGKDTVFIAEPAPAAFEGETIRLESEKLIVEFSTKGGIISSVQLKEFETYNNFNPKGKKSDGEITPLYLFREGDHLNELAFSFHGKEYRTGTKKFTVKRKSKSAIVLEHKIGSGSIEYRYALKGGYDVEYSVKFKGLGEDVNKKDLALNWNMEMRKTERLLSEQRKVSTICFQQKDGELDYLNEIANDNQVMEQDVNWLAYKQSYFSSILEPDNAFKAGGSKAVAVNYLETDDKYSSHIRRYRSTMALNVSSTENGDVKMNWFFGPNDYSTLVEYDKGYDDILNFGWGLFRWINLYAVQPVFDLLTATGMGIGIAILLLTLVLKLILMPIQWKMFVSSAKMRILKPDIDAINAKYPNKDDAMKKQVDMMALYRESGASPLAGCVPMLVQMPILLAVFRFFPAAFELRQKGFLWAEDMSSYDSIWDFGTYVPFYGDHMSLFTLLMAFTTLAYTYLNSSNVQQQQQPGMPNMKVIMYIFPVMMIFFFNNFASGLSYYYFISTLMTIVLMFLIKQFFVDEEKLKEKIAAARAKSQSKSAAPKKKSKFMERLEQAQKMQEEQRKNRKK